MSRVREHLERNEQFTLTGVREGLSTHRARDNCVLTCLDPRTDPAEISQLNLGDAAIFRDAGGRVIQSVIDDPVLSSYPSDRKLKPGHSPLFEFVVIHRHKCGTGFPAETDFRTGFALATNLSERELFFDAVMNPRETVRSDAEAVFASNLLSSRVSVSGHVYDIDDGSLSAVVPTKPVPERGHSSSISTNERSNRG